MISKNRLLDARITSLLHPFNTPASWQYSSLLALVLSASSQAATYSVDSYETLKQAIQAANDSAETDIIKIQSDIKFNDRLPFIRGNIIFEGDDHILEGDGQHRLFFIRSGEVYFSELTFKGGRAKGGDGGNGGGGGAGLGGALFLYAGGITLDEVTFLENKALGGHGGRGLGGGGGGLHGEGGNSGARGQDGNGGSWGGEGGFGGGGGFYGRGGDGGDGGNGGDHATREGGNGGYGGNGGGGGLYGRGGDGGDGGNGGDAVGAYRGGNGGKGGDGEGGGLDYRGHDGGRGSDGSVNIDGADGYNGNHVASGQPGDYGYGGAGGFHGTGGGHGGHGGGGGGGFNNQDNFAGGGRAGFGAGGGGGYGNGGDGGFSGGGGGADLFQGYDDFGGLGGRGGFGGGGGGGAYYGYGGRYGGNAAHFPKKGGGGGAGLGGAIFARSGTVRLVNDVHFISNSVREGEPGSDGASRGKTQAGALYICTEAVDIECNATLVAACSFEPYFQDNNASVSQQPVPPEIIGILNVNLHYKTTLAPEQAIAYVDPTFPAHNQIPYESNQCENEIPSEPPAALIVPVGTDLNSGDEALCSATYFDDFEPPLDCNVVSNTAPNIVDPDTLVTKAAGDTVLVIQLTDNKGKIVEKKFYVTVSLKDVIQKPPANLTIPVGTDLNTGDEAICSALYFDDLSLPLNCEVISNTFPHIVDSDTLLAEAIGDTVLTLKVTDAQEKVAEKEFYITVSPKEKVIQKPPANLTIPVGTDLSAGNEAICSALYFDDLSLPLNCEVISNTFPHIVDSDTLLAEAIGDTVLTLKVTDAQEKVAEKEFYITVSPKEKVIQKPPANLTIPVGTDLSAGNEAICSALYFDDLSLPLNCEAISNTFPHIIDSDTLLAEAIGDTVLTLKVTDAQEKMAEKKFYITVFSDDMNDVDSFDKLRAAIERANATPDKPHTIVITEDITLTDALPPLQGNITIEGRSHHTLNGDGKHRVFTIESNGQIEIKNLIIKSGLAQGETGEAGQQGEGGIGGGVLLKNGDAILSTVDFLDNQAIGGDASGGEQGGRGYGGAIYAAGSSRLTLQAVTFGGNSAFGGLNKNGQPAEAQGHDLFICTQAEDTTCHVEVTACLSALTSADIYPIEQVIDSCAAPPLAVDLVDFNALATLSQTVLVTWETASEFDYAGFSIWRGQPLNGVCSANKQDYKKVKRVGTFIPARGSVVTGAIYHYQDDTVEAGQVYCYALESIDLKGKDNIFYLQNMASINIP